MNVLEGIFTRRSVRKFVTNKIEDEQIQVLIKAATWAPSGKNGQPWKFKIITDEEKIESISHLSIYEEWMKKAPCFILVFLDKRISYHYVKDVQSCGAAIQNILLAAHEMGIGSCWIGEILAKENEVKQISEITDDAYELMGIVVLGFEENEAINVGRRDLNSFLL